MNLELNNNIVLITGGTGGIGGEIVAEFLNEDAKVICLIRSESKMAQLKKVLSNRNISISNLFSYQCDLMDYGGIKIVIKKILQEFKRIDTLVNCAGYAKEYPFALLSESQISNMIDLNLKSPMMLTQAVLKSMFRQKSGSIINISSIASVAKGRGIVSYASSKAGIETFTRTLAMEIGRKNVRINCIRPGVIETKMSGNIKEVLNNNVGEFNSLGRTGTPNEISKMTTILASDQVSSYITGECITIDGGII
jgi:3-oxoacyl-[acyl-carrier protein] reductase